MADIEYKVYGIENTWLHAIDSFDLEWQNKYLRAYYFCTVTMVTVGYGDMGPKNDVEYIVCIINMLISCGVFGYT